MTDGLRISVVGYASLDHKFAAASFAGAGRTTLVGDRLHGEQPELGAVSYFALEASRHEASVDVVTWVGDDDLGRHFHDSLLAAGVGIEGLQRKGSRSPASYMFYPVDGEPVTFFDPGDIDLSLTEKQREVVRRADVVVLMIGPPGALAAALDEVRSDALVCWVLKADPGSMPPEFATRLAERADLITFSSAEAEFLRAHCGLATDTIVRPGRLVVKTRGADGVSFSTGASWRDCRPPRTARPRDVTGAGDTFAGGLVARYVLSRRSGQAVSEAVTAACADAAEFLMRRDVERNP